MQIGPRIRFDKHTAFNLLKNVSPAAALLGGPLGLAAAGGLSALGDLGRGKNIKQAAIGGLKNAAIGGGLQAGQSLLAAHGAAGAVPGAVPGAAPSAISSAPSVVSSAPAYGALDVVKGAALEAKDAAGGILGFAEAHPNATSGLLQGIGSIAGGGADNRLTNARADQLEQEAGETAYDFERRKRRDTQLAPLWSSSGNDSFGYGALGANPYLPKVG